MNKKLIFHCGYTATGIVLFLIEMQLFDLVSWQNQFRKQFEDTAAYPYVMLFIFPMFILPWILLIWIPLVYLSLYSFFGFRLHKNGYITTISFMNWFLIISPSLFVCFVLAVYLFIRYGA